MKDGRKKETDKAHLTPRGGTSVAHNRIGGGGQRRLNGAGIRNDRKSKPPERGNKVGNRLWEMPLLFRTRTATCCSPAMLGTGNRSECTYGEPPPQSQTPLSLDETPIWGGGTGNHKKITRKRVGLHLQHIRAANLLHTREERMKLSLFAVEIKTLVIPSVLQLEPTGRYSTNQRKGNFMRNLVTYVQTLGFEFHDRVWLGILRK